MTVKTLSRSIRDRDRRALARAITLIESTRPDHRTQATELLQTLASHGHQSLRIGLSGTPGVGKSTFIENFGLMLIECGLTVAVLTVDPSSARSGGSILGDKTRMPLLSRAPQAFIRPSPAKMALGGVARHTRDAIILCEAARYDIILVETVGVGQSETEVAQMTDIFVLLLAPAGGDELQGVKRGIIEFADIIAVNKADGDLKTTANRTRADYAAALHLLRRRARDPDGFPKALTVSALESTGLSEIWQEITGLADWRREKGLFTANRERQSRAWFRREVEQGLLAKLQTTPEITAALSELEQSAADGKLSPEAAAARILKDFGPAPN